jgi:hypothetical protein
MQNTESPTSPSSPSPDRTSPDRTSPDRGNDEVPVNMFDVKPTCPGEILCLSGWKDISKVTLDDKIATMKDGILKYENPTSVSVDTNYHGKLLNIETADISLDLPVNYLLYASEDGKKFQLMTPTDKKKLYYTQTAINNTHKGIYSERFIPRSENSESTKDDVMNFQVMTDEELVADWKRYPQSEFGLCLLKSMCQLNNETISHKQACMLVDALVDEDDCFTTPHEKDADYFMELCLFAGWVGCKTQKTTRNIFEAPKTMFIVELCRSDISESVKGEFFDYSGPVYNIDLPSRLIYLRRNGIATWVGTPDLVADADYVYESEEETDEDYEEKGEVEEKPVHDKPETDESEEPPKKRRKWCFIF